MWGLVGGGVLMAVGPQNIMVGKWEASIFLLGLGFVWDPGLKRRGDYYYCRCGVQRFPVASVVVACQEHAQQSGSLPVQSLRCLPLLLMPVLMGQVQCAESGGGERTLSMIHFTHIYHREAAGKTCAQVTGFLFHSSRLAQEKGLIAAPGGQADRWW